jgi:hypothetical protein
MGVLRINRCDVSYRLRDFKSVVGRRVGYRIESLIEYLKDWVLLVIDGGAVYTSGRVGVGGKRQDSE